MTERVRVAQQHAGELLAGRTVWMVNSTALGGGVAQLLRTLLPYWKGAGIDVRWVVLRGSGEFFRVTKRFHNHLQGQPGDGDVLGIEELTTLDRAALYHARALASLVAPGDVVVLNDPQTAAMSVPLERAGATVIWSCHIGIDHDNEYSRNAWRCLRPRLTGVRRFVFSRYTSLPEWLGGAETSILTPGIDPGSTKNLPMPDAPPGRSCSTLAWPPESRPPPPATTARTGPWRGWPVVPRCWTPTGHRTGTGTRWWSRWPGGTASRTRSGSWTASWSGCWRRPARTCSWRAPTRARSPMTPRQKPCSPAVRERWRRLPPRARARVHVACLPLTPAEENAAMVNAIQRLAAVVVKKSLQEGFGLGVTEAMWKARPVVASAVGGHLEQVQHRHSGLLVADPADVGAFGDAIVELLQEPPRAARLGQAARERARALFLNDRHFVRWIEVFGSALEPRAGAAGSMGPAAGAPAHPSPGAAALDPGDRDALTGLWNRRRFETELDRARQNAEHLALLSIDVDRYREVIQRHGPAAAQGLIQAIAHVLAERLRPNDTLARMGGDEFAAVFRHATPPLIQSLADGLCTAVREQSHATGTNRIPATISIGAAFFDAGTQTHHEALRAADTALHEAKVAGGDRAIVHEPRTTPSAAPQ